MLGWVILVTTLVFLLYVTTMSLKLRNILTKSTLVTSVIAFQENSCLMTLSKRVRESFSFFWFDEEKYLSIIEQDRTLSSAGYYNYYKLLLLRFRLNKLSQGSWNLEI